jgi:hypothetical protein
MRVSTFVTPWPYNKWFLALHTSTLIRVYIYPKHWCLSIGLPSVKTWWPPFEQYVKFEEINLDWISCTCHMICHVIMFWYGLSDVALSSCAMFMYCILFLIYVFFFLSDDQLFFCCYCLCVFYCV